VKEVTIEGILLSFDLTTDFDKRSRGELATTMTVQRGAIEAPVEAGIREQVKVMVGGAPVSQEWSDTIGADGCAEDAVGAVTLAKWLVS
jgi:methanogenic corrinoid protein MtbC1